MVQPRHLDRVNQLLDSLQAAHPRIAYDVLWSAGDEVHKMPRLLQMVDSGALPAEFLRALEYGIRDRALTTEELRQTLDRLVRAAQTGNSRAAPAAVHLLYSRLHPAREASSANLLWQDGSLREVAYTVLDLALDGVGREPNFWMQLVDDLAGVAPERAVRLAVRALASQEYNTRALAEESLVRLAGAHPNEVMHCVGEAISSPRAGWRFRVDDFSRLLGAIPVEVVQNWLDGAGVDGARGLARSLELPYLEEGRAVVPPLTALVLDRFADDKQVFREFCAGAHSGQVYSGDIAGLHEREAETARRFVGHPSRWVREWALVEIESSRRQAAYWRQRDEEMAQH